MRDWMIPFLTILLIGSIISACINAAKLSNNTMTLVTVVINMNVALFAAVMIAFRLLSDNLDRILYELRRLMTKLE